MRRMSWTFRVPFQNIKSYIVSRPPAALFALCLASFFTATLSLALYVKYTSSSLRNPDEKGWNDVSIKFNKLNFCLLPTGVSPSINTTGMGAASVPFDMVVPVDEVWKEFTVISGSVAASELGFHDYPGTNLSFSLSLMQSQNKICLNLFHPPYLVMPRGPPSCNSLQFNPFPKSIGAFVLPREDKRSTSVIPKCPEKTGFSVKLRENQEWTVLLGKMDRALASFHLMVTSAVLLAVFLSVVCFAAIRGKPTMKPIKISNLGRESAANKEPLAP